MIRNSQGPSFVHCGTPAGTASHSEKQSRLSFILSYGPLKSLWSSKKSTLEYYRGELPRQNMMVAYYSRTSSWPVLISSCLLSSPESMYLTPHGCHLNHLRQTRPSHWWSVDRWHGSRSWLRLLVCQLKVRGFHSSVWARDCQPNQLCIPTTNRVLSRLESFPSHSKDCHRWPFSEPAVLSALKRLNPKKAADPMGYPTDCWKSMKTFLSAQLQLC